VGGNAVWDFLLRASLQLVSSAAPEFPFSYDSACRPWLAPDFGSAISSSVFRLQNHHAGIDLEHWIKAPGSKFSLRSCTGFFSTATRCSLKCKALSHFVGPVSFTMSHS
jgi:hypothetical protein